MYIKIQVSGLIMIYTIITVDTHRRNRNIMQIQKLINEK